MDNDLCIIYVTASGREEAATIGRSLVSARLAACANVCSDVASFYRWEGAEQEGTEALLIAKTRTALFPKVEKMIKEMHSYSCPCILAVPILRSSEDYADWIIRETT